MLYLLEIARCGGLLNAARAFAEADGSELVGGDADFSHLALERRGVGTAGCGFDAVQAFGRDLEEQAQHVVHHGRIFRHQRSVRTRSRGLEVVVERRSPEASCRSMVAIRCAGWTGFEI